MPSGEDDGHLPLLAFNVTGTRLLKAVCDASGDTYSYTSRLVDSWDGGVYGEDQGSGTTSDPVGWVILAGNDVGLEGRSHHYICGSVDYSGSRGFGFCSGEGLDPTYLRRLPSHRQKSLTHHHAFSLSRCQQFLDPASCLCFDVAELHRHWLCWLIWR